MSLKGSALVAALLATAALGPGCRSNESQEKINRETPGETGTPDDAQTPGSAQGDPAEAGTAPVGAKPTDGGLASTGAELPMPVLVAGVAALLAGALLLRRRAQAGEDQ